MYKFDTFMLGMLGAILCWFVFVLFVLRWMSGLGRKLNFDPGEPIRSSTLGSGRINDVHLGYRSMRIVEYPKGWLVVVFPTWFFGVKWLPKLETVIGEVEPATWYRPWPQRLPECGSDIVRLDGDLADFVGTAAPSKMEPELLKKI